MARVYRYPTSIRLSMTFKRRLKHQADRLGHTVAGLIVFWLEQRLTQEEIEHPWREKEK